MSQHKATSAQAAAKAPGARAASSHAHARKSPARQRWSQHVTQTSDALDLKQRVFTSGSADSIARSLKRSALNSRRRKASPFQSAMSMLNFYINRAGRNLPARRRSVLEAAKEKLREQFDRPT